MPPALCSNLNRERRSTPCLHPFAGTLLGTGLECTKLSLPWKSSCTTRCYSDARESLPSTPWCARIRSQSSKWHGTQCNLGQLPPDDQVYDVKYSSNYKHCESPQSTGLGPALTRLVRKPAEFYMIQCTEVADNNGAASPPAQ